MDGLLQIALEHPVQLQPLPARDPQRGISHFVAEIQLGQQLVAGEPAAGDLGADHEHEGLLRLAPVGLGPRVPIVLLITRRETSTTANLSLPNWPASLANSLAISPRR